MSPDTLPRCASCRARLPADAGWCTLCLTPVAPAAGATVDLGASWEEDGAPDPYGHGPDGDDPGAGSYPDTDLVDDTGHASGHGPAGGPLAAVTGPAVDARHVDAMADRMLAELAAGSPRLPGPGWFSRSMSNVYASAGVAAIGVGVVTLVVLVLFAGGGALL